MVVVGAELLVAFGPVVVLGLDSGPAHEADPCLVIDHTVHDFVGLAVLGGEHGPRAQLFLEAVRHIVNNTLTLIADTTRPFHRVWRVSGAHEDAR